MHKPPNCFTFLGVVLVEVRPDLSSCSSDVLPLLKRACHSKHLARLMASFLYARCIVSKVSAPDLPSFTQNLVFALCSSFTSMLKSQMWRDTWWQTLVLCYSQCSHSDAARHAEWWRSLLPSIAHWFTYCHRLAVYGTSLETFWYTIVYRPYMSENWAHGKQPTSRIFLSSTKCDCRHHRSIIDCLINVERRMWNYISLCYATDHRIFHLEKAYDTTWQCCILRTTSARFLGVVSVYFFVLAGPSHLENDFTASHARALVPLKSVLI